MRVQLPPQIKEQIEQAIRPVLKIAQETYRKNPVPAGVKTSPSSTSDKESSNVISEARSSESLKKEGLPAGELITPITKPVEPTVVPSGAEEKNLGPSGAQRLWTIGELLSRIEEVAEPDERPVITNVFNRFRSLIERKI